MFAIVRSMDRFGKDRVFEDIVGVGVDLRCRLALDDVSGGT